MKNILKIYILVVLFIFILVPFVNTFAIDMNIDDYESNTNNTLADDYEENFDDEENVDDEENSPNSNTPTITTTSSEDDEFLTIENILSIIIIVIGIILIFLAIAILIRCK